MPTLARVTLAGLLLVAGCAATRAPGPAAPAAAAANSQRMLDAAQAALKRAGWGNPMELSIVPELTSFEAWAARWDKGRDLEATRGGKALAGKPLVCVRAIEKRSEAGRVIVVRNDEPTSAWVLIDAADPACAFVFGDWR